jgi:membrane-associated protease RseP (regulator of RpoE activity)
MKYFKSALVGIIAMFEICVVIPALVTLVHLSLFLFRGMQSGGAGIAFGPVTWHAPTLRDLLFLLSAFGLGFFWELWRVERRQLPASQIEFQTLHYLTRSVRRRAATSKRGYRTS